MNYRPVYITIAYLDHAMAPNARFLCKKIPDGYSPGLVSNQLFLP